MTKENSETPSFDWEKFQAEEAERRHKAEEALRKERAEILTLLQSAEVTEVEAFYDGYGDSGNVSEVSTTPTSAKISEFEERLKDFVWEIAYMLHPGFEIDDGGEGTLTWDVTKDRIDLDHADFFSERVPHLHEDI